MSKSKDKNSGVASGYLHGFTTEEQNRLYWQARIAEQSIFEHIDFAQQQKILEVGCGVGAQSEILLERFPHIQLQGVDASETQVERARKHLARQIGERRASIDVGDALHLTYPSDSFDGAFVCWLLEHVPKPVEILREIRRVLRPSGVIFCNEVLNATFYVHPYSPATLKYWFEFNDHQFNLGGDPFVGAKLANYLIAAGYQNVSTRVITRHHDNRAPKQRAQFIEFWTSLLLSGAPALIAAGKVTDGDVAEMKRELALLKDADDSVFFYSWVQARAQAF
jgi:ubiquinone/menaquinone biosynthesis C-methylase UbiE